MEKLLAMLKSMPEYKLLLSAIENCQTAAVTGVGQINRSHIISGLLAHNTRPVVVICQDDITAKRLQAELAAFSAQTYPILPTRELTFYDSAVVSREWEQKRLRQLYALCQGETPLQILTWEALSQRTMPVSTLLNASFTLAIGSEYPVDTLIQKLNDAGYRRCAMVEGPGQYAVRGGILDIFSPATDLPVRAEFFGDELDTMGYFNPEEETSVPVCNAIMEIC